MHRGHLIDRAIEWANRTAGPRGISQAALRRSLAARSRPSTCYVSHLVQLGEALVGLSDADLEAFRSPRLTYRVVSEVVRRTRSAAEIRSALRAALAGGRVIAKPSPRRQRSSPVPEGHGRPLVDTWRWDPGRAVGNPLSAVALLVAHLDELHREAAAGLKAAIDRRHERVVPVGQSLLSMRRAVDARSGVPGTGLVLLKGVEAEATAALELLGDAIARARAITARATPNLMPASETVDQPPEKPAG